MATITKRLSSADLATAEIHRFGLSCFKFHGQKYGILMGTVTKRLVTAFTAGAPEIGLTCLYVYRVGGFLCDNRVCQEFLQRYKVVN
ncbi:MAG: hypothetical protein ACI8Z1_001861 [Candidatus Azotimanducaceae bacterium]|jgi:hypothetical protein